MDILFIHRYILLYQSNVKLNVLLVRKFRLVDQKMSSDKEAVELNLTPGQWWDSNT